MLAAPMPGASDAVLGEAVAAAVRRGLVTPDQHAVCLLASKDDLVLKVRRNLTLGLSVGRVHEDGARGATSAWGLDVSVWGGVSRARVRCRRGRGLCQGAFVASWRLGRKR